MWPQVFDICHHRTSLGENESVYFVTSVWLRSSVRPWTTHRISSVMPLDVQACHVFVSRTRVKWSSLTTFLISAGYRLGADRETCVWAGVLQSVPRRPPLLFPDRKSVRTRTVNSMEVVVLSHNCREPQNMEFTLFLIDRPRVWSSGFQVISGDWICEWWWLDVSYATTEEAARRTCKVKTSEQTCSPTISTL